jgi:hypothetical protein
MKHFEPNSPEFIVSDATPLAREILKVSQRLALEIAKENLPCNMQEYLSHLSNATNVLSTIVANKLIADSYDF